MRLRILMLYQDDPKKCTAAKLVRFGLASGVRSLTGKPLVLDPFSDAILLPADRHSVSHIASIDCSWNQAEQAFSKGFEGTRRSLPPLLAGNPVNYSKLGMLTTVEAMSASLFIFGLDGQAHKLLDKFKWGHTFYDLNRNLLADYSRMTSRDQIPSIMKQYGLAC